MTNGGVMIGSTDSDAQHLLVAEVGARDDQREREAQAPCSRPRTASASSSVFQATPQRVAADDAAESPDLLR